LVAACGFASADSILAPVTVAGFCGVYSYSGLVSPGGGSASWTCPTVAALLPTGATLVSEFITLDADFSSPISSPVSTTTVYSFSGGGSGFLQLAGASDTISASGGIGPTSYSDTINNVFNPQTTLNGTVVLAGFYDNVSSAGITAGGANVTIGEVNTLLTGTTVSTTGYAVEYLTYLPAVVSAVPEPGTYALLGSALIGLGLLRKRLIGK